MAKKGDRRREKRRRREQAAQRVRRRERRQAVEVKVARVQAAFGELFAAIEDERVTPAAFAERVVELASDELCETMLADSELAADQGAAMAESAGKDRGQALAAALAARAARDPRLSWLAVGLADGAGNVNLAEQVAEQAMARDDDDDDDDGDGDGDGDGGGGGGGDFAALVARLRLETGRLGDALGLLDAYCARYPAHDDLQGVRARCLARAAELLDDELDDDDRADVAAAWPAVEPDQLTRAGASLSRFADRTPLYELREAVEGFVATEPGLASWRSEEVASFLAEAREAGGLGPLDELGGGQLRLPPLEAGAVELVAIPGETNPTVAMVAGLAAEWAWLSGPDQPGDEEPSDEETVLARFAAARSTPAGLAEAARSWLRHVRYGLWQPSLPPPGEGVAGAPAGGVWVTDVVTRQEVYAAIPPEQLDGLPRWSVLAGALAPVDGVWRSGLAMIILDPVLADRAAEAVLEMTEQVVAALARDHGFRPPKPRRRDGRRRRPHGVLAELTPAMDDAEANITTKVLGSSLPRLIGMVEAAGRQPPGLANTDGDPLELLRATFPVADPLAVHRRLLADPDFEADDDEPVDDEPVGKGEIVPLVRWLGRQMSASEAATSLAQYQAEARKHGWGEIVVPKGPRRWMRGTIHFEVGQVRVEVNSRRRLDAAVAKLRQAGATGEPRVQVMADPAMDLALPTGRLHSGRAGDPEAEAAWRAHWLDEPVPALDGATPRAAAKDPRRQVLLESLLRQFEHDADLAAAAGERPIDVDWLRDQLSMKDGVLSGPSPDTD